MKHGDFTDNLRLLCSFEKSVAAVCRAVNINRQQFTKYLNGENHPSPNNLHKICNHFGVPRAELYLPAIEFAERMQFRASGTRRSYQPNSRRILDHAFPGDLRALRRYLGYYMTHYHSISWSGYILRTLTCVYEEDGMILTKTIDRVKDPFDGALFLSKYDGYVSLLGNRIFAVEFQSLAQDAIVETVLYPAGRGQLTMLRGVTFGVSSKHRNPYISRAIWKYLGRTVDHRTAIRAAGLLPIHSPLLDRRVLQILGEQPFANEHLHYDMEPSATVPV